MTSLSKNIIAALMSTLLLFVTACGSTGSAAEPADGAGAAEAPAVEAVSETKAEADTSPLAGFPPADLSAYGFVADYDQPLQFVDMTVADVVQLVDAQETFAFVASFAECPWCNAAVPRLNRAAIEAGEIVGLIDTRKDPSWENNMDIADYDLFVEYFGNYLEEDEDGKPHLYTPHTFFIKDGAVVYQHQGALPEMDDDPAMTLNDTQEQAFVELFAEGFRAIDA